ncbi:MAG TPA: ubiquitin-like domain-containing protein [Actinomycetota bacterium]|nr:ubiquitin-like domain-containing protein [Actinomycetota bacterium]
MPLPPLHQPTAGPDHAPAPQLAPAAKWLLRLLVIGVAVGAPVLAFAGQRRVTVDVEGKVKQTATYATSATELLERKGVTARRADLVTPGRKNIEDGDRVVFRRAKSVRLVVDGDPRRVLARGLTVGEALHDLGLVPGPKDHVFPESGEKLRPTMSIFVRNAIHAKVRVDGRLRDVVSSADTVRNLLTQAGVAIGKNDYVFPARDTEPRDGMWIRVVRVRRIVTERSVRLPFEVVTHRDANMESGVRKIIQQGGEGLKVQRFSVLLEDGRRVSSTLLSERVLRPVRNHIVRVGVKEPAFKGGGGSQEGVASWYAGDGMVAAHRTLPIGSIVRVTNVDNGRAVNVRITNRGPFMDGRLIDLGDDAFQRLAPLGKGTIRVKVQS